MENYKEEIENIKRKAQCEFIRKFAYQNTVQDNLKSLEIIEKNKIIINQNRKIQKIRITLTISLVLGIILLNLITPDLLEKALAFVLVFGIILFVPLTICLLFGVEDLFWKIFKD